MSNQPQKVKIEKADYDENSDTIVWTVRLANGKIADLVWIRSEFGPTFKIDALIPIPLVKEFCGKMIGKYLNLIIDPPPPSSTSDNTDFTALKEKIIEKGI